MKNLLIKEFKLAMHPTVLIFIGLSFMVLIPNYPFYVTFFYTTLGLFFVCLTGRENHDIDYTLMLPIRKQDAVRARVSFFVIIEIAQLVLTALAVMLRNALGEGANQAGMDANIAFFGLSLIMLGVYNYMFFTKYYRAPDKVGSAFTFCAIIYFVMVCVAEACSFAIPFVRDRLDTPDPMFIMEKLVTLALGLVVFALLTIVGYRKARDEFERLDI